MRTTQAKTQCRDVTPPLRLRFDLTRLVELSVAQLRFDLPMLQIEVMEPPQTVLELDAAEWIWRYERLLLTGSDRAQAAAEQLDATAPHADRVRALASLETVPSRVTTKLALSAECTPEDFDLLCRSLLAAGLPLIPLHAMMVGYLPDELLRTITGLFDTIADLFSAGSLSIGVIDPVMCCTRPDLFPPLFLERIAPVLTSSDLSSILAVLFTRTTPSSTQLDTALRLAEAAGVELSIPNHVPGSISRFSVFRSRLLERMDRPAHLSMIRGLWAHYANGAPIEARFAPDNLLPTADEITQALATEDPDLGRALLAAATDDELPMRYRLRLAEFVPGAAYAGRGIPNFAAALRARLGAAAGHEDVGWDLFCAQGAHTNLNSLCATLKRPRDATQA